MQPPSLSNFREKMRFRDEAVFVDRDDEAELGARRGRHRASSSTLASLVSAIHRSDWRVIDRPRLCKGTGCFPLNHIAVGAIRPARQSPG
jgi:hypothetical protein